MVEQQQPIKGLRGVAGGLVHTVQTIVHRMILLPPENVCCHDTTVCSSVLCNIFS